MMEYDKEELTQTISTEELIRHFHNEEEVSGYCRECENFGRSWGCPPFDFDVEDRLKQYKEVLLVATKITPKKTRITFECCARVDSTGTQTD